MMEQFDAINLARLQFAFTITFHIVFPSLSIGLASYLLVVEGLWLRRGDPVYLAIFEYWKKIFALAFAMGVVSGVVLSYQFGTNWSQFSEKAGPVIGPLMGYEIQSAFFLEAGFLGIMLFGRERVGRTIHLVATFMVAAGTLVSVFWIMSVNSWMQTPAGHIVGEEGQFLPADWWQIIFNPSFAHRLSHMVLAAYLATAFTVGGVAAWHLLRDPDNRASRIMLSMAMWMALLVAPLQIVAGDSLGRNSFHYQPAKIAALEGHYETIAGAPLILFGIPDDEAEETYYKIEVPRLGSILLTHSMDGVVPGLASFPRQDRPSAEIIFWTFRVMVGIGFLMVGLGLWSAWSRWRSTLYSNRPLLMAAIVMGPSGFLAVIAGWITTEVGRQPWVVYGLMRTRDAASPVPASAVVGSLALFAAVYVLVFGAGIFYMLRLMMKAPERQAWEVPAGEGDTGAFVSTGGRIAIEKGERQ